MKNIIVLVLLLTVVGCDLFEYSPNQTFDRNSPRDLNAMNLERLQSSAADDTVTIAFVGDSQRWYDNVDKFVDKVNTIESIDFVILSGDITDFGLLNEFEWVHRRFSRLDRPYFAVIGNHDVIANGEDVFRTMFGPLNYSFVYDSIKFVMHNTNGREYPNINVPDLNWLQHELSAEEGVKYFIGVSHVPPMNGDFKPELVTPYTQLLSSTPGFLLSLHGHIHDHIDEYPYNDGLRYITSYAFNQPKFLVLKIAGGNIVKEEITY